MGCCQPQLEPSKHIPYQLHKGLLSAELAVEKVVEDKRAEEMRSIIESIKLEATTRNDRKLYEMAERLEQLLRV